MIDFLKELNEPQQKAVEYTGGPMMVIAGAGSGKTRVLTYKVAYLIHSGLDPFNILALTFTNKAAREMKSRVHQLLGSSDARNVWMGTFHSVFARILRAEGHRLGYPANFTIYDTDDSKSLIRSIVKTMNLDPKTYTASYVLYRISSAKTSLVSAAEYKNSLDAVQQDQLAGKPFIKDIYQRYAAACLKAAAMDFDDLLFNTNILLRDYPDVLLKYQNKFRYILVDEYQDTNYAQYVIVKKLAANDENICVVGDDAQSIYGFRGANIQNILNLKTDYHDLVVFKLEQNYRSTQNIVNAANSIIKKNRDQISKTIWTSNDTGEKIMIEKVNNDNEEGVFVARNIFDIKMNQQRQNADFAVLYRTNAQSRPIEQALRRMNIPYRIYGGLSFYHRKEIKDLLAYFRIVVNPNDDEALKRIINYPPRGIGKTTMEKLTIVSNENNCSLWQVISNPGHYNHGLFQGTVAKTTAFYTTIKACQVQLLKKDAYELGKMIAASSGMLRNLGNDTTPEGVSRAQNIEELLNGLKEFTETERPQEEVQDTPFRTLNEFMQEVALLTDQDTGNKDDDDNDKVTLMTIHAAKGLEFPFVFIVGVEENLFPNFQALSSRPDLEEERRLFYVALTRAEKQAFITFAENRYRWGVYTFCEPSRFIEEIDATFVDFISKKNMPAVSNMVSPHEPTISNKKLKSLEQVQNSNANAVENEELSVGMQVKHQRFGQGKIVSIEGNAADKKATVFFQTVGQKKLLLRFAKLERC